MFILQIGILKQWLNEWLKAMQLLSGQFRNYVVCKPHTFFVICCCSNLYASHFLFSIWQSLDVYDGSDRHLSIYPYFIYVVFILMYSYCEPNLPDYQSTHTLSIDRPTLSTWCLFSLIPRMNQIFQTTGLHIHYPPESPNLLSPQNVFLFLAQSNSALSLSVNLGSIFYLKHFLNISGHTDLPFS